MSLCSRCIREVLPGRRSLLLWPFAGMCAGAGAGCLAGLGLTLIVALGGQNGLGSLALACVFLPYGVLVGGVPGLLGGLAMAWLDRWLDRPGAREVTAALLGLVGGCLFVFYYPPLMLLTGPLGFLAGWGAAALVAFWRQR